jgi:hypothetical protein
MERSEVYKLIDGERDYQEELYITVDNQGKVTIDTEEKIKSINKNNS